MRPAVFSVRLIACRAGPRLRDLLAVARDDEQAVVDRQPQAESGGQVEGEDRDVDELVGDAQQQEGPDDRQAADHQRQQGGHPAAEEEQGQQEEDREGEQLGLPQVLLDLLVHLLLGESYAADLDAGLTRQVIGDCLGGVLLGLVVGRLQADREIGRVAVAGDEVAALGLEIAGHLRDVGVRPQLLFDALDPLPAGLRGGGGVLEEHDHAGIAIAVRLEAIGGLDALGGRVVGAVWRQLAGDAAAERAGDDEEDGGDDHRPLAVTLCQ